MRISDWSSDVCSSDLGISYAATPVTELAGIPYFEMGATAHKITTRGYKYLFRSNPNTGLYGVSVVNALDKTIAPGARKSVVSGTIVSVRVDLGAPPILKKHNILHSLQRDTPPV